MPIAKSGIAMVSDARWQERARGILKAEIGREGLTYKELVEKLKKVGATETAQSIANKMSRKGFSAAWLLQCLHAIGCEKIDLNWPD